MTRLYDSTPCIGIVLATYAAVPYVHLGLESWRRNYVTARMLVSDDGSGRQGELRALCNDYGVEFRSNNCRCAPTVGDLSSYLYGLEWARANGIDILVKLSRRFVPLGYWLGGLRTLATTTQAPTFSHWCSRCNFGFRTECVGLHVDTWWAAWDRLGEAVAENRYQFVEAYLHQIAQELAGKVGYSSGQPSDRSGYAVWPLMYASRFVHNERHLWHDSDGPVDYARVANCWGLGYTAEDFADPNMGEGDGTK